MAVHTTYAFPSGHTTASVYIIGVLLYVLLPLVLENDEGGQSRNDKTTNNTAFVDGLQAWRGVIWALAIVSTGAGRIIADAHWTTDVIAGGCLGVGLVALTALVCQAMTGIVVEAVDNKVD